VENSPFRQWQKYVEKARRWRPSRSRATHAFLILFAEFVISLNLHINQGILITLTPHCQCQCQCKPMAKVVAVAKKEALEMSQSKSNVLKLGLSSSWNCYGSVDYALSEKVDILILKSSKVHHLKCRLEPVNYQDICTRDSWIFT